MTLTVVLGGTRSGKSRHAERLAAASDLPVRYVGTGDRDDPAMRGRIDLHVARRPDDWTTVEVGASLADACADAAGECVLLDGLGPWIATQLHRAGGFEDPGRLPQAGADVLEAIVRTGRMLSCAGTAIVVAEQAGLGVLPAGPASRAWLDLLGEATQHLAGLAGRVDLVVAGRVIRLDGVAEATEPAWLAEPADDFLRSLRRHGDRDVRVGDADHAVNVVAGGPPAWLTRALEQALAGDVASYPREDAAVAAVAALHGRRPAEIVPTNGAAEALWLLGPALRPRLAACVHPGFTESEAALHAHRIPTVRVLRDPEHDFAFDPTDVPEAADLVVIGNPASPSGTLDPATAILAARRPGRTVVVDEAFMDLVPGEPCSLVREQLDDVIVIRSLTKALGIPGLRAGYAVAGSDLADRLRAVRPPWAANVLALAALTAAALHPPETAEIAERAACQRADLYARLQSIDGVRIWPGAANFVLVAVADGPAAVAALRARQIAVRPAASFPGLDDRFIRITARQPDDNARVADALGSAISPSRSC